MTVTSLDEATNDVQGALRGRAREHTDVIDVLYSASLEALRRQLAGNRSPQQLGALVASPGIADNPVVSQLFTQLVRLQGARDSLTTGSSSLAASNPDVKRIDTLISSTQAKVV